MCIVCGWVGVVICVWSCVCACGCAGVECSNSVAEAFSTIRDMFADKTQWSSIEKMFK